MNYETSWRGLRSTISKYYNVSQKFLYTNLVGFFAQYMFCCIYCILLYIVL